MPGGGGSIDVPGGNGPIDVPDGRGDQHHDREAEPPRARERRSPTFARPQESRSRQVDAGVYVPDGCSIRWRPCSEYAAGRWCAVLPGKVKFEGRHISNFSVASPRFPRGRRTRGGRTDAQAQREASNWLSRAANAGVLSAWLVVRTTKGLTRVGSRRSRLQASSPNVAVAEIEGANEGGGG